MDLERLLLGIIGGLAVFLYGMQQMTASMTMVFGSEFKHTLMRVTTNPVSGMVVGALATMACQSSGITTVLIVSLVSTGLLHFENCIGVVLGANVGSTMTGQLISFNIARYNAIFLATGVIMSGLPTALIIKSLRARVRALHLVGSTLIGLGLVLLGMDVMTNASKVLGTNDSVFNVLSEIDNRFVGILIGIGLTIFIQSSGAISAILISMATEGVLPLEMAAAVMVGSNVGSCIPSLLAALPQGRIAQQAAVAHLGFNLLLVIIWCPALPWMLYVVRLLPPHADQQLDEQAQRAIEVPRQIANAHTFANLSIALLLLPFTRQYAALIQRVLPVKPIANDDKKDNKSQQCIQIEHSEHVMLPDATLELVPVVPNTLAQRVSPTATTVSSTSDALAEFRLPRCDALDLPRSLLSGTSVEFGQRMLVRATGKFMTNLIDGYGMITRRVLNRFNSSASVPSVPSPVSPQSVLSSSSSMMSRTCSNDMTIDFVALGWTAKIEQSLGDLREYQASLIRNFHSLTDAQTDTLIRCGGCLSLMRTAIYAARQMTNLLHTKHIRANAAATDVWRKMLEHVEEEWHNIARIVVDGEIDLNSSTQLVLFPSEFAAAPPRSIENAAEGEQAKKQPSQLHKHSSNHPLQEMTMQMSRVYAVASSASSSLASYMHRAIASPTGAATGTVSPQDQTGSDQTGLNVIPLSLKTMYAISWQISQLARHN